MVVFVIILFYLLVVIITITYIIFIKSSVHYMGHSKIMIENIAFLLRRATLFLISFPRIYLLYIRGSQIQPNLTVKFVGSQWYWSFEVADFIDDPVLMYILPLDELSVGSYLFLETDNIIVLPTGRLIQFNVTRRDVIHRFAIPTLGMKVDATPGLLTVVHAHITKMGTHYGQCSEICGINHRFIPICVEVVSFQSFLFWAIMVNF